MATRKRQSSSGRKTKKERMQEMERAEEFRREIILWGIVAVSLLLFISNLGIGGKVGGAVSGFFFGLFGMIAYIFPIILLVGSFFGISNKDNAFAIVKLVAAILFAVFICVFLYLVVYGKEVVTPATAFADSRQTKIGGGLVGALIGYFIVPAFGLIGSYIIDIIVLIVTLVLITGKSAMRGMKAGGEKVYASAKENSEKYQEYRQYKAEEKAKRRRDRKVSGVSTDTKIVDKASEPNQISDEMGEIHIDSYSQFPEVKEEHVTRLTSEAMAELLPNENTVQAAPEKAPTDIYAANPSAANIPAWEAAPTVQENDAIESTIPEIDPLDIEIQAPEELFEEPPVVEKTKRRARANADEIETGIKEVEETISKSENNSVSGYVPPDINILHKGDANAVGNTKAQLKETAEKLEKTMQIFGVKAKVTDYCCGPTVTRYEVQPELGVKVSKIVNLVDDIKFALAATDVRIEAPIPGKSAVGIEVPNAQNVTVPFRDLVESQEFKSKKSPITFALGRDIAGQVVVADLAKMPHLMIAGSTGSGKSVCINTIITSILYKAGPDEVKLIMIDPKVVELSVYNGIPHLLIPVVTDPKKAAGALNWAVQEMTDRYQKFADANVREINGYNEKIETMEVPEGQERPKKMERIVVIVDELADLMMVASKDVETAICRLAQLARAAGIHLIIATQRPSADVITGIIRANMPSRIAFAVSTATDSRIILDQAGADRLLGKGDMLFNPQGAPTPHRIQGAFISDNEIAAIIDDVKEKNGESASNEAIQNAVNAAQVSSQAVAISDGGADDDGRDALFADAAKIIVDKEKASIGMLQRYLKVGFNRAARIMDQLEEAGIVGPEEGTKPRMVLVTTEELSSIIDEL
ncbi:MAG: DNA translocase FtsK [Lachnobacterium sp.]|nr:DNA translocase FtsK [Lachnobacterium sp.]